MSEQAPVSSSEQRSPEEENPIEPDRTVSDDRAVSAGRALARMLLERVEPPRPSDVDDPYYRLFLPAR